MISAKPCAVAGAVSALLLISSAASSCDAFSTAGCTGGFSSSPSVATRVRESYRLVVPPVGVRRRHHPAILSTLQPSKLSVVNGRPTSTQLALDISGENLGATTSLLTSLAQSLPPIASSLFAYSGNVPLWQACALNAVLFSSLRSKLNKMLTAEGFAHAFALGTLLWSTLGWRGWTLCVTYLFLGQAVTKVKFQEKEKAGIAEGRGGRRGPENVWGSALTGLMCAACSVQGETFLGISAEVYLLAYVASLSTKLADTFASEIGKAYGKTTFLITTFERVEPGTEGAVSAEGTLAAVLGGLLLSLYGYAVNFISWPGVLVSTVAAFLATNAESLIGATLQEKEGFDWMTNEVVNFINTLIGAAIAILGGIFILGM